MLDLVSILGQFYMDKVFFTCVTMFIVTCAYIDLRDKNYPPGPFGTPIFGYLPMLNQRTPYTTLKDLASHYGKVFAIYLGSVYTVVVSDVKLIREALELNTFHEKAPLQLANAVSNGKGILMADSASWKQHRYFLYSSLKTLGTPKPGSVRTVIEDKIQSNLTEFLEDLRKSVGRGARDVRPSLRHSIGSLMFDVMTGIRPTKGDPKWAKMQTVFANHLQMMSITSSTNFVPAMRNFSKFINAVNKFVMGKDETASWYKDCQDKFSSQDAKEEFQSIAEAYISEAKRREGKEEGSVSSEQVSQVLLDTIAMGWETTMNSIQWLFVYLAMHPEVQDNILHELAFVLGPTRRTMTLEDCKKLTYTEAVMMEVWRHRPVLPMGIPHCAAELTKIGNYWIRQGTLVVPLIYAVHRDQRYWDKPDDFIPERHLNDDGSIKKSEYYIPFQTGLRMCVGEDMAKWTVLLFLVGVVSGFRVAFPKDVKYSQEDLPDFSVISAPPPYGFILEARC